MDGIPQYVVLGVWLLSLGVLSVFICVVACISTSPLFMAKSYSFVRIGHILFTPLSVHEHLPVSIF